MTIDSKNFVPVRDAAEREHTEPIRAYFERANADGTVNFIAATEGIKRDGLNINMAGGEFDNFMRNPVFLWVHDYFGRVPPIGKVTRLRTMKAKIRVTVAFDEDDEFAMRIKAKYDNGFLNAVSIGWDTLEFDRDTMTVDRWDLLDVSAVPVPGDPQALVERQAVALRSLGEELINSCERGSIISPPIGQDAADWLVDVPLDITGKLWDVRSGGTDPDSPTLLNWPDTAAAMVRLMHPDEWVFPTEDARQAEYARLEQNYRVHGKTPPGLHPLAVIEALGPEGFGTVFLEDEWEIYEESNVARLEGRMLEAAKGLRDALANFIDASNGTREPTVDPDQITLEDAIAIREAVPNVKESD